MEILRKVGKEDQGLNLTETRYQAIPRVLVFLRHGSEVLLIKGATDKHIWANLYNGVGGHIEQDEDVLTAARREVNEETGLEISDLELKAIVNIDAANPIRGIMLFVFTGWATERRTIPSEEGELEWIPTTAIYNLALVEDLEWLLPRVLNETHSSSPAFLHYSYDENDKLVIRETE
jgi:8-oxo-dGTP diphosphatase